MVLRRADLRARRRQADARLVYGREVLIQVEVMAIPVPVAPVLSRVFSFDAGDRPARCLWRSFTRYSLAPGARGVC
jgi:hypothetical protein